MRLLALLVPLLLVSRVSSLLPKMMLAHLSRSLRRSRSAALRMLSSPAIHSATTTDSSEVPHPEYKNFAFNIHYSSSSSKARTAVITTPHGTIETPNFIFCATKAAMKAMTTKQLREENTQICLSNTYHLMVSPGADVVEKMGGLQKMTGWNGPMLTDSGGYQIFSMGHGSVSSEIKGRNSAERASWNQTLLKIDEDGATFRSYLDGTIHHLTPELSMEVQRKLGADLVVVLDECTPFNVDKAYTEASMHRSHRWAVRCIRQFASTDTGRQALYGIVQGGVHSDLRQQAAQFVNSHPFFGLAIGGSLGGTKRDMHDIVTYTRSLLRNDRPVHLLGIGGIRDVFHGVRQGIDTFDCVHPSRLGRHGGALVLAEHWDEEQTPKEPGIITPLAQQAIRRYRKAIDRGESRIASLELQVLKLRGCKDRAQVREKTLAQLKATVDDVERDRAALAKIESGESDGRSVRSKTAQIREHVQVTQARMRFDPRPLDASCQCYTCKTFSRAYLHHLFKADESLGGMLVTIHNVHFMNRMMRDIREGIVTNTLDEVERRYVHPTLTASLDHSEALSA